MWFVSEFPVLSLIVWLPILGALVLLAWPGIRPSLVFLLAFGMPFVSLLLTLTLWWAYLPLDGGMQFHEQFLWISSLGLYYRLGVDGISLPLLLLSNFMTLLVVFHSCSREQGPSRHYLAAFLLLAGLMNGVFVSLDVFLFYVFWEAMLIPMFLIIGVWGGSRRVYATIKFFLYTFLGSVFLLVALIYLYLQQGSSSLLDIQGMALSVSEQRWLFGAFLLAFAVKIPMWPVHTWLPDAHVEAPTEGSVILAALLLKMGAYGLLRFSLPITPGACQEFALPMVLLSLAAVIYIALVALVQRDMKKLIAYSSIAHMGFVTLGLFAFLLFPVDTPFDVSLLSVQGALIQIISHGFISGALFFCVGMIYQRLHSRDIQDYGGVVNAMPHYAALFMFFAMANAGLPGTSGFVGEFLVILASFQAAPWIAFFAALTLVLGAAYTLWMYKRVIYGAAANERIAALPDLVLRERLVLWALVVPVLGLGLYPLPLWEISEGSLEQLLFQVLEGGTP